MSFWRNISPKRAVTDFADTWSQPNPHRWLVVGVAFAATAAIFSVFIPETKRGEPVRPEVTYITSWAPDRTREEIVTSNLENQARKDERAALLAKREEVRKELYRTLGRATFIDVDAIDAQLEAERAAEEAAGGKAKPGAGDR